MKVSLLFLEVRFPPGAFCTGSFRNYPLKCAVYLNKIGARFLFKTDAEQQHRENAGGDRDQIKATVSKE